MKYITKLLITFFYRLKYLNLIKIKLSSLVYGKNNFEGKNVINKNCIIKNCNIGFGTYIGNNGTFSGIKIGRYCSIGSGISVITHTHPSEGYISTHPSFFSLGKQAGFTFVNEQSFKESLVCRGTNYHAVIGNDVWIGNGATIMGGVKIGNGAIIGAKALVTKDVGPYSIVGGVPAKTIRKRFSEKDIDLLEKSKWWDKDYEWLKKNYRNFEDIDNFKNNIND